MASNWSVCGVCDYRHITKPSVVWCAECDEGLCKECKDHHGISKGTRSHGIVSISEYQKLPGKVLQLSHSCKRHNEKYQLFCKVHDCPCCKKCIVETHNHCKEFTDLGDITRHIKSSNAFTEIELTLSEVAENVKRLRINREDNLASLSKRRMAIEKEVKKTRAKINQHLDKLQDAILKDLETREEEESNKIRLLIRELIDKEKQITEHHTNIANIKQHASELQTFLALKHIENDVTAEEQYIQSMVKSESSNQIDLSCKIHPLLQGKLSAIQKFGDVVVTADPSNIQIQKHKDKQAQIMVAMTPKSFDSLKPTVLKSFNAKLSFVTGCTLLPDGGMAFACSPYQKLHVLKPDGSPEFTFEDLGPVFDLTLIDDNSVAVTSGYDEDSLQISLIDLKRKKLKKILKVNSENTGVAYREDTLIYCAVKKGIQKINLTDESIVNVTRTMVDYFSYVATFRDKMFYTQSTKDTVTCIDFQGKLQWMFKNKSIINVPYDISVDGNGNVYVVGEDSNNVVIISPNGHDYRQVLTSENGLEKPVVVHVDRSNCKMLVANREGKAIVYSLV